MEPTRSKVAALAALLAVCGCGTTIDYTASMATPPKLSPRPAARVELLTFGPPRRAFIEVGIIEVRQDGAYARSDHEIVLGKLRAYAGQLGCEAVVVARDDGVSEYYTWDRRPWEKPILTRASYRGACIVYAPEKPAEKEPAPKRGTSGTKE